MDKKDIYKLRTIPSDFSKLTNVVDALVTKVDATDNTLSSTGGLVLKTQVDSDKLGLKRKMEDIDKNGTQYCWTCQKDWFIKNKYWFEHKNYKSWKLVTNYWLKIKYLALAV